MTTNELADQLAKQGFTAIPGKLVSDKRLTNADVRIALTVACYARGMGEARLTNEELAALVGHDSRTVTRSLARLVATGWIILKHEPLPPWPARVIRLNWSRPNPEKRSAEPVLKVVRGGDKSDRGTGQE
jgi:hypothetical protein